MLIIQISCVVASYPLRYSYHTCRGIDISDEDPYLFSYSDTDIVNKQMIASCLRMMCDSNSQDTLMVPIDHLGMVIIELANMFVKDGAVDIILGGGPAHVPEPVTRRELRKLYQSFMDVRNIEAKDIVDAINLHKKILHVLSVELIEVNCLTINQYLDLDKMYGEYDLLICGLTKISRKYKEGIIDTTPCPKAYYVCDFPELSDSEKIELLECMIERLNDNMGRNIYGHHKGYDDVYDARIKRWRHVIDSLQSHLP